MKILITLSIVYIISFLLIFLFIYNSNKKETEEEKVGLFLVIFSSVLLALCPTAAIAFVIFALLGSASIINSLFSLNISMNHLVILTICILLYLFIIDSVLEKVLEYMFGNNIGTLLILVLVRILVFYMIGSIIEITYSSSLLISIGVAIIIFIIELLELYREKSIDIGG